MPTTERLIVVDVGNGPKLAFDSEAEAQAHLLGFEWPADQVFNVFVGRVDPAPTKYRIKTILEIVPEVVP